MNIQFTFGAFQSGLLITFNINNIFFYSGCCQEAVDNLVNMTMAAPDPLTDLIYMHMRVDVAYSALVMEVDIDDFETDEDLIFEVCLEYLKIYQRLIICAYGI